MQILSANVTPLLGVRILAGLFFIPHVLGKILPPHGPLGFFKAAGFPLPEVAMYTAAAAETAAAIGLTFGILTFWSATIGALVLLVASAAVLVVGAQGVWLWNFGGIEYPLFWALTCGWIAWTHRPQTTARGKFQVV